MIHQAHFVTHLFAVESLCGTPGASTFNFPAVTCRACLASCDWAMDNGLLEQVRPDFWVVNGNPPRFVSRDDRDDYEFWYYAAPAVRVTVREPCHCYQIGPHEHVAFEYRAATPIPRPYTGRALRSARI